MKVRPHTAAPRTRFARLHGDGSISVEPFGIDFIEARRRLLDGNDDCDTEILEVELRVVRSHGAPKLQVVAEKVVTCPTCGEEIHIDADAG